MHFICQPACLPTVKPSSTSSKAPQKKGNRIRFTKLLYQLRFFHCAMVTPFIIQLSLLYNKVQTSQRKVVIGDDMLTLFLCFVTQLQHVPYCSCTTYYKSP